MKSRKFERIIYDKSIPVVGLSTFVYGASLIYDDATNGQLATFGVLLLVFISMSFNEVMKTLKKLEKDMNGDDETTSR